MSDSGGTTVDYAAEIRAIRREQQKQRGVLFGNGKPGLDSRVDSLENAVLGDPRANEPGLKKRMATVESNQKEHTWILRLILALLLAMSGGMDIRTMGPFLKGMFGF